MTRRGGQGGVRAVAPTAATAAAATAVAAMATAAAKQREACASKLRLTTYETFSKGFLCVDNRGQYRHRRRHQLDCA